MKKIFLILFLLVSSIGSAQTYNANLFKGNIFRISDSLNVRGAYSYWGTNGHVFNLNLSTLGRFLFKMNGTTDLLDYDYDNGYWTSYKSWLVNGDMNITGSYKVNGVVTGGGDAYLSNRQTFTKRNTFDSLNVTKIVSDLPFYKASNTWLWTKDNYKLFLGANNDTAIEIATNNSVRFYESINVDNSVNAGEVNSSNGITTLSGTVTGYDLAATHDGYIGNDLDVLGNISIGGEAEVTGDLKSSNTAVWNFGTFNNYGLNIKTNSITRLHIDTSGNSTLTGTMTANLFSGSGTSLTGVLKTANNLSDLANITTAKTNLSLQNVENTALSTWAGTTNITTLGTISSGTWNGSLLTGTYGGTGVNNGTKTITLGNNFTTSGNFATTLYATGTTTDTLPTSGTLITKFGTETLYNKTLSSPTITGVTRGIIPFACYLWSPVDNANYWFGGFNTANPSTTEGRNKLYIPVTCTITKISISSIVTGTAATNDESTTYKLKRTGSVSSDTASYTITTAGKLTAANTVYNYSATVSIAITAGDYIEIKAETPNYNTNPTNVVHQGLIEIQ